jgi:hypothetical protein
MTKTCNHCGRELPLNEFNWRYKSLGVRQPCCRECQKNQKNDWYIRNQESERVRLREQKSQNKASLQAYIWDYLSNHPCIDCGEADPRVLEFDHVRGDKHSSISKMVTDNRSLAAVQEEIQKCVVRCSNCHRRRHYKDYGGFRS